MMNPKEWRWYRVWMAVMNVLGLLATLETPLVLAFSEISPKKIGYLDIAEFFFMIDVGVQIYLAVVYRSDTSHDTLWRRVLFNVQRKIILLIPCVPWITLWTVYDIIFFWWMILFRMVHLQQVHQLLSKTKNYKIGFISTIDLKILTVNFITSHLICCTYLCTAMSMPQGQELSTWLGALVMGEYSYSNFRNIRFRRLYITSFYFGALTFSSNSYGDIHPVSEAEMIIAIVMALFGFYWTDVYVKEFITKEREMERPSNAEQNRNQMTGLEHDADLVPTQEPLAIRLRKCRDRHRSCIQQVPLFRGCTEYFINEIASRVYQENFEPGQEVIEEGYILEQLYFLSAGELVKTKGGSDTIILTAPISLGDISILKHKPSPYTVKAVQPSSLLRLDTKTFNHIMNNYKDDCRRVKRNLVEDTNDLQQWYQKRIKEELELAVDLNILAHLDQNFTDEDEEVDVNLKDYLGKTPLHIAAARGNEKITRTLIQNSADVDAQDDAGNTPLMEALLGKHKIVADLLLKYGAIIKDGGPFLCKAVETDDVLYVEWLLNCGMDVNSKDKDGRTSLHFAARRGCVGMVKLLMEKGAKIQKDKWGTSPREEAILSGVYEVMCAVGAFQLLTLKDVTTAAGAPPPEMKQKLHLTPEEKFEETGGG